MKFNLLSFATKNWENSKQRILSQSQILKQKYNIFNDIQFLNEDNLGEDYYSSFGEYVNDPGFAYWSWKPYIISNTLKNMNDGDILMYIDGGCSLPDSYQLVNQIKRITSNLNRYELPIAVGQSQGITPIIIQVRTQVLNKFELLNNIDFLMTYPHYEAGMQIILNNNITRNFMNNWYTFMVENYKDCIHSERYDKTGQYKQFWRNGGDQQIFQCMLYKNRGNFCDLWDFWYRYKICTRITG